MKNHKFATLLRRSYRVLNLIMVLAMMLAPTMRVSAFTTTDKPEYTPGSIVTISGDNTDVDIEHNFAAGEPVIVEVVGPNGYTAQCLATADDYGAWSCEVTLLEGEIAYGEYSYTATGQISGNIEYGTFLDGPPSIDNLWQWATGTPAYASNMGWQHGNINEQNSTYFEGEVIPYYTTFSNMIIGHEYKIQIEWDTTKGGLHALDYITTYDYSYTPIPPCDDAGITCSAPDTIAIPEDTFMTSQWLPSATQIPGDFTAWNADLLLVSEYTNPPDYLGDTSTSIWVTFKAESTEVVLAWGGHIGARIDWGMLNSAVFISGSPYHMRILEFWNVNPTQTELNVGNTDRSLSASAVIFPAHVTVIKVADPEGTTPFPFTGGLGDFTLIDDGTLTDRTTIDVVVFGDYDIMENVPSYWQLDNIVCTDSSGIPIIDLAAYTATVNILEADVIECTFYDSLQAGDITIVKQTDPDGSIQVFDFTASYDADGFSLSDGQSNFSGPLMPGTYNVAEIVPAGWELSSATCDDGSDPASIGLGAGEHVTCTFNNYRLGLDLIVTKTAFPHFTRTYEWMIEKTADAPLTRYGLPGGMVQFGYDVSVNHDAGTDSAWYITGEITIANPNLWQPVTLTNLADGAPEGDCELLEAGPYTVPANSSIAVDYRCDFLSGASGTNTATATWSAATYHTPTGTDSGTADYAFTVPDTIVDESIDVVDDHYGVLGSAAVGETMPKMFSYNYSWLAVGGACTDYRNTATFTTNDTDTTGSDFADVEVCSGLDLTVTKTATASYDRLYKWLIDKSVDQTRVETTVGGLATFNYTVLVTPNGFEDLGWELSGTITVTNPNDWEAITATVTDVYPGGVCTVTGGVGAIVPASGHIDLPYSCTFASQPAYTGTNTATAVWDAALYKTPTGTDSGTADVTLDRKSV